MAPPNLIITDNFIIPWLEFSQTKTTWLCLFGEKINNFVKMFWVQSLCFHLIFKYLSQLCLKTTPGLNSNDHICS